MSRASPPRLLIVPGLNGSGADHWQTWLEQQESGAERLRLTDWSTPVLERWTTALDQQLAADRAPGTRWLIVAHSLGCLAVARWLLDHPEAATRIHAALLVAPANPSRFQWPLAAFQAPLPCPSTVVSSRNDPWFDQAGVHALARHWGANVEDAGAAGHINAESGHGPWPRVQGLLATLRHSPPSAPRVPAQIQRPRALGFAV